MDEERLQNYYKSCHEYFNQLQEEEFDTRFLKYYKSLSSRKKNKLILDVGCGVGQVVIKLAKDGLDSVGIDVSPIAIKIGVEGAKKNPHAFFVVASGYQLPFKQEAFEVAGCLDVLEHLKDPELCLSEMLRVIKKEGIIVVASPNLLCPVYADGFKRRASNMKKLFLKIIRENEKVGFERIKPRLDWTGKEVGRDLDAINIIDPITIKKILERRKVKIVYQSSYLGSRRKILERLSTLPLFRSVGGGIFLVGKLAKTRVHISEEWS